MHCNVHAPPASIPIRTLVQRTASYLLQDIRDLIIAYSLQDLNSFFNFSIYTAEVFNILEKTPSSVFKVT
jgi:hypothetical protein